MSGIGVLTAWAAGGAGAALLYLTAPKQQALAHSLPRWVRLAALVPLAFSYAALLAQFSPATAAYTLVTLLMAVWSIAPVAVALWRRTRS